MIPDYTNVYAMPLATAGLLAMMFSLPSGVIRAAGGWMSDKWGSRSVMYGVLFTTLAVLVLNITPPIDIYTPGEGLIAARQGTVTAVTPDKIILNNGQSYALRSKPETVFFDGERGNRIFPVVSSWQKPVVQVGDKVARRQLLAKGITHVSYAANVWVFTVLLFIIGITTGIGKAAVFKYIPDYSPRDIGVVGGLVGLIGALG